jgi:hypothetical protein
LSTDQPDCWKSNWPGGVTTKGNLTAEKMRQLRETSQLRMGDRNGKHDNWTGVTEKGAMPAREIWQLREIWQPWGEQMRKSMTAEKVWQVRDTCQLRRCDSWGRHDNWVGVLAEVDMKTEEVWQLR